jgi:H+/gluconate symporter-like permease
MAKTFTAPFAQTPKTATAVATGAATVGTDSPSNTVLLMTAGADGCIVTSLAAMPRATVTASSLVLFLSKDSGTTQRLIDSELMSAFTVATTTAIPETTFSRISESSPLRLEAGDKLYIGSQVALASGIVFTAQFTDF